MYSAATLLLDVEQTYYLESSFFKETLSGGNTNIGSHENEHQNDVQAPRGYCMSISSMNISQSFPSKKLLRRG
jgi:hypothetical protein